MNFEISSRNFKDRRQKMKNEALEHSMSWKCSTCGFELNVGKYCKSCGAPKSTIDENEIAVEIRDSWKCLSCGTLNHRNYCYECGRKKPIEILHYHCQKCGWESEESETYKPNFCPECGDKIEDEDIEIELV